MKTRHTLNGKLIIGAGIIALAAVAVAPKLAWGLIPLLFIVACPLMMLLMMRGMGPMGKDQNAAAPVEMSGQAIRGGAPGEQRAQYPAANEAAARPIVPIEAEGQLRHGPAPGAQPARMIPVDTAPETREHRVTAGAIDDKEYAR